MKYSTVLILITLGVLSGCVFSNENDPVVYSGNELKIMVPSLYSDTSNATDSIKQRQFAEYYSNCNVDSSKQYVAARAAEGWIESDYYYILIESHELYKITLTKSFNKRAVTLRVRCDWGWDGSYESSIIVYD